jgi:hypothetical protein
MAHGNFDTALTLNADGTLTVCGPIHWAGTTASDLPAVELEITLVVISQRTWGGRHVIGTATPHISFTPGSTPSNEWMLDVTDVQNVGEDEGGRGFEAGPANALAIVRLKVQGRARTATEMWNESVHLS